MAPPLVYIMGTARSGTTMLEILLAQSPEAFGAGELTFVAQDGFVDNVTCSCSLPSHDCPIWSAVREETGWTDSDCQDVAQLCRQMDHHERLPKAVLGWPPEQAWTDAHHTLLRSIRTVTGRQTIIDSSKYAARALNLHQSGIPASYVRMVRHPRGLMHSWQKPRTGEQPGKTPTQVMAYYTGVGGSLWAATRQLPDVFRLTHESLSSDPDHALTQLEATLSLDLSAARAAITDERAMPVGHILTGNRLRKSQEVRFDPSKAHQQPLGLQANAATTIMRLQRRILGL